MNNVTKHTVNGRNYEIRTRQTDHELEVATFYDGNRIARYAISLENAQYVQHSHWQPPVKELVDIAKGDLEAGIVK